jgi:hypothetical protein
LGGGVAIVRSMRLIYARSVRVWRVETGAPCSFKLSACWAAPLKSTPIPLRRLGRYCQGLAKGDLQLDGNKKRMHESSLWASHIPYHENVFHISKRSICRCRRCKSHFPLLTRSRTVPATVEEAQLHVIMISAQLSEIGHGETIPARKERSKTTEASDHAICG